VSSAESTAIASSVNNPSVGTAQTLSVNEPMQEFKQVPMAMLSGSGNKVKGGKKGQTSVESRLDYVVSKTPVTSSLVRYNGFRENIAAYSVGN
jgi:hypothetical protein